MSETLTSNIRAEPPRYDLDFESDGINRVKQRTHTEATNWQLKAYYGWAIGLSVLGIAVAIGQLLTKRGCLNWKSTGDYKVAYFFEIVSIVTIILGTILIVMSALALYHRMGFKQFYNKYVTKDDMKRTNAHTLIEENEEDFKNRNIYRHLYE